MLTFNRGVQFAEKAEYHLSVMPKVTLKLHSIDYLLKYSLEDLMWDPPLYAVIITD